MENNYFVKFRDHSQEFYELIKQRPSAFVLLAIIADRARKIQLTIDDGIEVGEAFIGDYQIYGATEQTYKTDKKKLINLKIITIRTTNKGTIAKIVNPSIFDISRTPSTSKRTDDQQPTNEQSTTKQEVRSQKQEREKGSEEIIGKTSFSHTDAPPSQLHDEQATTSRIVQPPVPNQKMPFTLKGKVGPAYWDTYAPKIAYKLEMDPYTELFENARATWIEKAKVATHNSIETFLKNAKEQALADVAADEYYEEDK
jgi:hypothetical protein